MKPWSQEAGHEWMWLQKSWLQIQWGKFPDEIAGECWLHKMDGGNLLTGTFFKTMVATLLCRVSL